MDSTEYVKGLIGWSWDVELSSEGYCYLSLVRHDCQAMVAALLGPWPTVASLLALGRCVYLADHMSLATYSANEGSFHVMLVAGDGGSRFLEDVLRPASRGYSWPVGSLGSCLCDDPRAGVSSLVAWRVGGPELVKPLVTNERGCLEYNRIVGVMECFERLEKMVARGMVINGLSLDSIERFVKTNDDAAQVSNLSMVGKDHERGPNWERNRATKAVQRVRRQEAREKYVAESAVQKYKKEAQRLDKEAATKEQVGGPVPGAFGRRGHVVRTPEEEELHKLRVERQIIQERRRLEKLKSPTQIIEDAMRMVDFAQKCAKQQNDSKVAAWAAALSQASAESIAKSGSMPSVESLSSVRVKTVSSESSVSGSPSQERGGSVAGPRSGSVTEGSCAATKFTSYREFVEKRENRVVVEDVDGSPLVLNKVPASRVVGSLAAGTAVTTEGRSIDSNGVAYTKATALAWVRRYDSCIRKHASIAKSDEQIAKDAGISLAEVKKYYRLRKEFGL